MDSQSDLEVILEFLEDYYRENAAEHEHVNDASLIETWNDDKTESERNEQRWKSDECLFSDSAVFTLSESCFGPSRHTSSTEDAVRPSPPRLAFSSGRKMRLFHFLFEMLEDPDMSHCVSWVSAAPDGVFCFSSRNKDEVAALWGQRKGNKRPMTYQKMSRALRNYSRSGEIYKVKKKLTYRFSPDTLVSLQRRKDLTDGQR